MQFARMLPTERERLLRVDVFASGKRRTRDFEVARRSRQIDDRIDVRVAEHLIKRIIDRYVGGRRQQLRTTRIKIHRTDKLKLRMPRKRR